MSSLPSAPILATRAMPRRAAGPYRRRARSCRPFRPATPMLFHVSHDTNTERFEPRPSDLSYAVFLEARSETPARVAPPSSSSTSRPDDQGVHAWRDSPDVVLDRRPAEGT